MDRREKPGAMLVAAFAVANMVPLFLALFLPVLLVESARARFNMSLVMYLAIATPSLGALTVWRIRHKPGTYHGDPSRDGMAHLALVLLAGVLLVVFGRGFIDR